jgi:hypothetical protein
MGYSGGEARASHDIGTGGWIAAGVVFRAIQPFTSKAYASRSVQRPIYTATGGFQRTTIRSISVMVRKNNTEKVDPTITVA